MVCCKMGQLLMCDIRIYLKSPDKQHITNFGISLANNTETVKLVLNFLIKTS